MHKIRKGANSREQVVTYKESMSELKLTMNALAFYHNSDQLTCYFRPVAEKEIDIYHPDRVIDKLREEVGYTTGSLLFALPGRSEEGLISVTRDTRPTNGDKTRCWSISMLKAWYQFRLKEHFLSAGLLIQNNFLNNPEVWVPLPVQVKPTGQQYQRFEIRVQWGRLSKGMELLIIYSGITTVMNTSVSDYIGQGIDPDKFTEVVHYQNILRYKYPSDEARRETDVVFPKLNYNLRRLLSIPFPIPDKSNHYHKYKRAIDGFRANYLQPEQLSDLFTFSSDAYIAKETFRVETDNRMVFGYKTTNTAPQIGFKNGPVVLPPAKRIQMFYIMHKEDGGKARKIHNDLIKLLKVYSKMDFFVEGNFSIVFEDKNNPLPEIRQKLDERQFKPDRRYVAFYLSPHNKYEVHCMPEENEIYYKIKEELHNRDIASQTLEIGRAASDPNFHYWVANIASAIVAKLGGVPWQLPAQVQEDMIVGVGAFNSHDLNCRFVGSAFSFTNDGRFYGFECFRSNEVKQLAGSIKLAIREFRKNHDCLKRLIIHFYKEINYDEAKAVHQALNDLKTDIPVYILSINKTHSSDVLGFDTQTKNLMPPTGTAIEIGWSQFLFYINGLEKPEQSTTPREFPFPLKVSVYAIDKSEVDRETAIGLLRQLSDMTLLYWKSVKRQYQPVTIAYPALVAQIFPHFEHADPTRSVYSSPWFL